MLGHRTPLAAPEDEGVDELRASLRRVTAELSVTRARLRLADGEISRLRHELQHFRTRRRWRR